MTPEQIVIWIIVGGLTGFLANLMVPHRKLRLVEAISVGILGAFVGKWLLILGAGTIQTVLAGFLGAAILLAIFVGVRAALQWSHMLRQRKVWSLVQPFEE